MKRFISAATLFAIARSQMCQTTADCVDAGWECFNSDGWCHFPCTLDSECNDWENCNGEEFCDWAGWPCALSTECGDGQTCENNHCVWEHCGNTQHIGGSDGFCQEQDPSHTCQFHTDDNGEQWFFCALPLCTWSSDCPPGFKCENILWGGEGQHETHCTPECHGNDQFCQFNNHPQNQCIDEHNICGWTPCESNQDCLDWFGNPLYVCTPWGECQEGCQSSDAVCRLRHDPDSFEAAEMVCTDIDICDRVECQTTADCDAHFGNTDFVCDALHNEDKCTLKCNDDSDCHKRYWRDDFFCNPGSGMCEMPCQTDLECLSEFSHRSECDLQRGVCELIPQCAFESNIRGMELQDSPDGWCEPVPCFSDGDCSVPGYECEQVYPVQFACSFKCSNDDDCNNRLPASPWGWGEFGNAPQYCAPHGICEWKRGCGEGCADSEVCSDEGYCALVDCRNDRQCQREFDNPMATCGTRGCANNLCQTDDDCGSLFDLCQHWVEPYFCFASCVDDGSFGGSCDQKFAGFVQPGEAECVTYEEDFLDMVSRGLPPVPDRDISVCETWLEPGDIPTTTTTSTPTMTDCSCFDLSLRNERVKPNGDVCYRYRVDSCDGSLDGISFEIDSGICSANTAIASTDLRRRDYDESTPRGLRVDVASGDTFEICFDQGYGTVPSTNVRFTVGSGRYDCDMFNVGPNLCAAMLAKGEVNNPLQIDPAEEVAKVTDDSFKMYLLSALCSMAVTAFMLTAFYFACIAPGKNVQVYDKVDEESE